MRANDLDDRRPRLPAGFDPSGRALRRRRPAIALHQRGSGSSRHAAERADRERTLGPGCALARGSSLSQVVDDAGAKQRRLADTARPVEDREPGHGGCWRRSASPRRARRRSPRPLRRYGTSPTYGVSVGSATGTARPPEVGHAARPARSSSSWSRATYVLQRNVEEIDVAPVAPERLLDLTRPRVARRALHGPRLEVELLLRQIRFRITRRFQSRIEYPRKRKWLSAIRSRSETGSARRRRPRQVVDVVVLGDDVAVALQVGAVDRAVQLEDHRSLVELPRLAEVLVRAHDRHDLAVRRAVDEASPAAGRAWPRTRRRRTARPPRSAPAR